MLYALKIAAAVIGLLALSFASLYLGGFLRQHAEGIRYNIQKESQTYKDGMMLQTSNLCRDYNKADSTGKASIIAMSRDLLATVDTSEYPAHLQQCLRSMNIR